MASGAPITKSLSRYVPALGCLALIAALAVLRWRDLPLYLDVTRLNDGIAKPWPFVDLRDILQAGLCWREGVDVYRPSACLWGGIFNYAPMLLRLALLPLGPRDTLAGGLLFCAAYAYALTRLPPAEDARSLALITAAALSPAAFYALEQGNLDTLIFAATVPALCLPWRHRGFAYAVFALGAAAKFYPASLFILALRERRRTLALLSALGLAAILLIAVLYGPGLIAALRQLPSATPFRASFGRSDLTNGLARLHLLHRGLAPPLSWALAACAAGLGALRLRAWRPALKGLAAEEARFLVAGAALILACFMAAQNFEYRAIFLILTLPGLTRLAGRGWSFCVLPWIVLALLWEALPRVLIGGLTQPYLPHGAALALWLLREALWWWLAVEFAGIALAFVTAALHGLCCTAPRKTARNG